MNARLFLSLTLPFLFLFFQNDYTLKGIVLDDSNSELIGANVILKKGKKVIAGTVTDFDGKFELSNLAKGNYTLHVSYTGYETIKRELVLSEQKTLELKFVLKAGALLEEVVVSGYSPRPKKVDMAASQSRQNKATMIVDGLSSTITGQSIHYNDQQFIPTNTEEYEKNNEVGFKSPLDEALSTFSLDVDRASYSNVRRMIDNGMLPPPDAVRLEEMVNYFDYDYRAPGSKHPIALNSTYTVCPWNDKHQILHIGVRAKDIKYDKLPKSNLVFLIDVSGSMNSSNKLPLVISSFKMLLKKLRGDDRVAIVTYAGRAGVALESTPAKDRQKILNALEGLRSGGSTAGAQGILTAYEIAEKNFLKDGNNRVILATDGDFNVGVNSVDDLESLITKKRKSGVFLSILGYGMGNYKDNKMQALSDKGNGNHAYIDNLREARKVLINEFGGTLFTVAKDVKIQIEFNPAYVHAYRLLGYENRRLNKEDFNDDKKDAGEVGAGHKVTAIYEIIPVGVKSGFNIDVDPLKYQSESPRRLGDPSGEVATIKCRYKHPDEDKSLKFSIPVYNTSVTKDFVDSDVAFALAVAEFSLRLSESQYLPDGTLDNSIQLAENNLGKDKEGYRSEFVRLAKSLNELHGSQWTIAEK